MARGRNAVIELLDADLVVVDLDVDLVFDAGNVILIHDVRRHRTQLSYDESELRDLGLTRHLLGLQQLFRTVVMAEQHILPHGIRL